MELNEKDLILILYDKQDLLNNINNKQKIISIDSDKKIEEEYFESYHNIAKEISAIRIQRACNIRKKDY